MKNTPDNKLPVHSLGEGARILVQDIRYKNPYDFTREHRHSYFEIFFFENGGGRQLIDFMELPVVENSCYIVFPQQVHLLNLGESSSGRLVQFREEALPSTQIKSLLRQVSFADNPAIFFEGKNDKIIRLNVMLDLLQESISAQSEYANDIALHHLQALLLQLLSQRESVAPVSLPEERKLLFEFQNSLEENYRQNHEVKKYASGLDTTEKKLTAATRKYLGLTPLQVIHNRVLLEAKRILLFENTSHKEIAFALGFDSPASFSLFIKNKTGLTPSDLYAELVKFHE